MTLMVPAMGVFSGNCAAAYRESLDRVCAHLEEASRLLHIGQPFLCQKEMTKAQQAMDEASDWFARANVQALRINVLVSEVKLLRSGNAVSYPTGHDPIDDGWEPIFLSREEAQS